MPLALTNVCFERKNGHDAGVTPLVSAEPHKGGRGKVKPIKQKAIATGKVQGIGMRTMQRALAKAEGKTPLKPHRPTNAERARDKLLGSFSGAVETIGKMTSATPRSIYSPRSRMPTPPKTLGKCRDRLKGALGPAAA
jgi:hypothetical protein